MPNNKERIESLESALYGLKNEVTNELQRPKIFDRVEHNDRTRSDIARYFVLFYLASVA